MNTQAGIGSGRDGFSLGAIGELIKKRGRHLRAAGVVYTGKDYFEHRCAFHHEQQVGPQQGFTDATAGLIA